MICVPIASFKIDDLKDEIDRHAARNSLAIIANVQTRAPFLPHLKKIRTARDVHTHSPRDIKAIKNVTDGG